MSYHPSGAITHSYLYSYSVLHTMPKENTPTVMLEHYYKFLEPHNLEVFNHHRSPESTFES
jgi:hypothetical protein